MFLAAKLQTMALVELATAEPATVEPNTAEPKPEPKQVPDEPPAPSPHAPPQEAVAEALRPPCPTTSPAAVPAAVPVAAAAAAVPVATAAVPAAVVVVGHRSSDGGQPKKRMRLSGDESPGGRACSGSVGDPWSYSGSPEAVAAPATFNKAHGSLGGDAGEALAKEPRDSGGGGSNVFSIGRLWTTGAGASGSLPLDEMAPRVTVSEPKNGRPAADSDAAGGSRDPFVCGMGLLRTAAAGAAEIQPLDAIDNRLPLSEPLSGGSSVYGVDRRGIGFASDWPSNANGPEPELAPLDHLQHLPPGSPRPSYFPPECPPEVVTKLGLAAESTRKGRGSPQKPKAVPKAAAPLEHLLDQALEDDYLGAGIEGLHRSRETGSISSFPVPRPAAGTGAVAGANCGISDPLDVTSQLLELFPPAPGPLGTDSDWNLLTATTFPYPPELSGPQPAKSAAPGSAPSLRLGPELSEDWALMDLLGLHSPLPDQQAREEAAPEPGIRAWRSAESPAVQAVEVWTAPEDQLQALFADVPTCMPGSDGARSLDDGGESPEGGEGSGGEEERNDDLLNPWGLFPKEAREEQVRLRQLS